MTDFITQGGWFPIVLLAHGRAEVLRRTLQSLSQARGFDRERLIVAQDGDDKKVARVLQESQLEGNVNDRVPEDFVAKTQQDKFLRVAAHYKWSIDLVFERFPDPPGVIIVEDDFIFSPDFLEYFQAVAPILDNDSSLWLVSAWNDNGFTHVIHDTKRLHRTEFLPNLGWLMPRMLWYEELADKWPDWNYAPKDFFWGWDHWMRDVAQHQGREVVFPQVPRLFHTGVSGTSMTLNTHQRYFAQIGVNRDDSVRWEFPQPGKKLVTDFVVSAATHDKYVERITEYICSAEALEDPDDLRGFLNGPPRRLVIWYWANVLHSCPPICDNTWESFDRISKVFGIWHEPDRSSHRGVHELWVGNTSIFLVNIHPQVGSVEGGFKPDNQSSTCDVLPDFLGSRRPRSCNPKGEAPCCMLSGSCVTSPCKCPGCMDYSLFKLSKHGKTSYAHLMRENARVFRSKDFEEVRPLEPRLPAPSLKIGMSPDEALGESHSKRTSKDIHAGNR